MQGKACYFHNETRTACPWCQARERAMTNIYCQCTDGDPKHCRGWHGWQDEPPCGCLCHQPSHKPQPQELYDRDERGIAILTPAGFAALDRYHEMTDRIEELITENDRLRAGRQNPRE